MAECKSKVCNPGPVELAGPVEHVGPVDWIDPKVSPDVLQTMKETILDNETLKKEMDIFLDNINRGLKKDTHPSSVVKCFPTYVQDLPNGTETGKFLALDLGGTNFRVLLIELAGGKCEMKSKIYVVPLDVMVGPGAKLFDHIADCLANFANEHGVINEHLPLGFTFSFPLQQKGLCIGILERWTKGFNCEDIIGQDVVQLLKEAIERRGDIKIDVCAVLNDTTGTLMSCAWKNHDCRIGLIVGTGNNGCYVETQQNAEMFDEPDMGSGKVIINLEMGAFGDDGALDFIRTDVDREMDKDCINQGRQLHEKMISGMYLGEMVRLYLVKLANAGLIFGGQTTPALLEKDRFTCKNVSEVETDQPRKFPMLRKILNDLGIQDASDEDCINVRFVCECITRRSAHLIAASMCVLLHKIGEKKVSIGVDGSVYKYHPNFRRYMLEKMAELIDPGISYDVMLSEDGSGRGAALVAAVAARSKTEKEGES